MLEALGGVREGRDRLDPLRQVTDRLGIGRTLDGALTSLLPVGDRLRMETRFGVMMGE